MKRNAETRGRNRVQGAAEFSLFPFLAVLVCTMGTLIVVLVVITHQARVHAAQTAAAKAATVDEDLKIARELCEWRASELKAAREKTLSQLAEARLQLGHLEDHARRLRDELARLEATWNELERAKSGGREKQESMRAELARLRAAVAQAEKQVTEARRDAQVRSYAVLPYQGPNETRRRPIYIECRLDAVVLQPEGIALSPSDFEEPLEAGNPLDSALRAAREYLVSSGKYDPKNSGEPYPLLLVRPDGAVAYGAARAVIQSWGSEFGYELIGEDWQLAFPPPDPRLAEIMAQAVDSARHMRERLAQAQPRRYAKSSRPVYRAAPTRGGVVRVDQGDDEEEEDADEDMPRFGGRSGRSFGGGGGGYGASSSGSGERGLGTGSSGEPAGGTSGSATTGGGGLAGGDPAYQTLASGGGQAASGAPAAAGMPDAMAGSSGSTDMGRTYGLLAERNGSSGTPGGKTEAGNPLRGHATGRPPAQSGSASDGQGQSLGPGEWMPNQSQAGGSAAAGGHVSAKSLAKTRGKNWALPEKARASVPVIRPVRVDCYADRLAIVPEQADAQIKIIPFGQRTEQSVDRFVEAVWQHMESWGMAGRGMYWRPMLNMYTAPGADARAADLEAMLEGSGLEVRRR